MATTFDVISLGVQSDMDTIEGNNSAEGAGALVGLTFGGAGDALVNDVQTLSPGSTGTSGGVSTAYDMNNNASNETFSIDGGPDQTFDGTSVYNATITYIDGTTATITAVIFQDTDGNTYLAPEFSANSDQVALEAAAIRSLTLDSLLGSNFSGLTASREDPDFVTCFTAGARILTLRGERPVEELQVGDLIMTQDRGAQPVRWIGTSSFLATGRFTPIRIEAGALGMGLPVADLVVSQQHRMIVSSKIAQRVAGQTEVLVAAKKLLGLPGISYAKDFSVVSYYHILLDHHEIIFAEGAPTESLLTGPVALKSINAAARKEIEEFFPQLIEAAGSPARVIMKGDPMRQLLSRHRKNAQPLLQS
ncbi:Hint domain-containing protein [uncultured Litoreibacter sp.]|uniref:Hint domain-containing protein n=1 Tax=uncultured Litoreibacter sp. TaxID=1392394 RepID=UPI00262DB703|nr:Hint domain-containing protein [uncultured Litoreibacter sp.]